MTEPQPAFAPLPPLFGRPLHALAAAGVFLLAVLIVFCGTLIDSDAILSQAGSDTAVQFVGWIEFTFGEMARGNLPLWNPHLYSGAPCLGGFQEALLYPLNWIHLVLSVPQGINIGIALHVLLAGFFTYLWMARRGLRPAASILAGLCFMLGGAYFMHIAAGHLPNLHTMVWAPLIFLAIDDLTSTRSLRGAWLGAGAGAMQILAGHPQYVYYTALAAGVYALISLVGAPYKGRAVFGLLLMGVGVAALSAAQLFTGLAASQESMRSSLTIHQAWAYPLAPENLLTLVFPNIFGPFDQYWGRWFLWEDSLFIGATALSLAVYGALHAGGRRRQRTILTALALALFVVAIGAYTPLYGVLFKLLPGFGSFRGVSKMGYLAALFVAALVGEGLDGLLDAGRVTKKIGIAIAAASVAALAIGSLFYYSADGSTVGWLGRLMSHVNWRGAGFSPFNAWYGSVTPQLVHRVGGDVGSQLMIGAAPGILTAALWLAAVSRRRQAAMGLALLAGIELIVFASGNCPTFNYSAIQADETRLRSFVEGLHVGQDARLCTGRPCIALGAGVDEAWGNDPMVLRRYVEFMRINQHENSIEAATFGDYPFFDKISPTWGMVRLRAVFVPVGGGRMQPVAVPGVQLSRIQLIEDIRVIPDKAQRLAAMADHSFNPKKTVILESPLAQNIGGNLPAGLGTAAGGANGPVGDVHPPIDRSTDEMEISAHAQRPCVLLISDNFAAGWHAEPLDAGDARSYSVVPADHTLLAIPLAAGDHHFLLRYLPKEYVIGKWTSIAALVLYALATLKLWVLPKLKMKLAASTSTSIPAEDRGGSRKRNQKLE